MSTQTEPFARKKSIEVLGRRMAYIDEGEGAPVVFAHGNPTSSYLWRNVMPACRGLGRLIACDMIGMGDSEKLPDSGPDRYTYAEQRRYLFALWEKLGIEKDVVLVLHDWGSALGFDWGNHHRGQVRGIVYMEAIVRPLTWSQWPEGSRRVFQGFRSEAGEEMVLDKNMFVERVLPASILRRLEPSELEEYRRPFAGSVEARWPTLSWPREIPIDGEPALVVQLVSAYAAWMAESNLPKLFVNADPGAILVGAQREFCRKWPNQTEITVTGSHFIQEDSGPEIGRAIAAWVVQNRVG